MNYCKWSALVSSLALALSGCPKQSGPATADPVVLEGFTEEVSFEADGLTLEGTLHVPARPEGQAVAGVLLIHGSGPNSRDEAAPLNYPGLQPVTVATFVDIAEALSQAGYAVLRYDKRTCGPFNGLCDNDYPAPGADLLVSDFMSDAAAAADFLGGREEVDEERLAVAGHSQGGTFVPLLLADHPDLAVGLMLAGPYQPIHTLMAWQAELQIEMMIRMGLTQAAAEAQIAFLLTLIEELTDLHDGDYGGDSLSPEEQAFWSDWFALGDRAIEVTPDLPQPIRAISGTQELNVPPGELEAWATLFASAPSNPGHETELHDCVTHSLNCVIGDDILNLSQEDVGGQVHSEVIEGLLSFLETHLN